MSRNRDISIILGATEAANTGNQRLRSLAASDGGGTVSYDSDGDLPTSGNNAGDLAFVKNTQAFYGWDSDQWIRLYGGADEPLSWTTEALSEYSLSPGQTTTVTTVASDPEGYDISYSFSTSPSNQAQATITNNNNGTFSLAASNNSSNAGTFTLRTLADDGLHKIGKNSSVILAFGTIVDQTSTYTTPLSNATNSNYPSSSYSAASSYSSSDYSWTLGSLSQNFGGFRKVIDWDVDNQSEILFAVAMTGAGTTFNSRGGYEIGFQNSNFSKNVGFYRSSYNPDNNNYLFTRQDATSLTIGSNSGSGFSAISETSNLIGSWYMAMRINLSTGAAKGWISEDSGSTWTQSASGTYANPGDLTHAYIATNRRTGTGNKIALLDASNYSSTLTL